MNLFSSGILVLLGFIPSLIWLVYYYSKDPRPEPKYMVSRIFFLGIILAPLAVVGQWVLGQIIAMIGAHSLQLQPQAQIPNTFTFFLVAAFIEEIIKFLPVKFAVLHNPEFDEPIDSMIYMIAAALGFAAIENILALFQMLPSGTDAALKTWALRFVGATFLHAVSSAIVGYFLALSWFYHRHSQKLIPLGITIAAVFHFIFNITLLRSGRDMGPLYSTIFLLIIAIAISPLFDKLKKKNKIPEKNNLSTEAVLP